MGMTMGSPTQPKYLPKWVPFHNIINKKREHEHGLACQRTMGKEIHGSLREPYGLTAGQMPMPPQQQRSREQVLDDKSSMNLEQTLQTAKQTLQQLAQKERALDERERTLYQQEQEYSNLIEQHKKRFDGFLAESAEEFRDLQSTLLLGEGEEFEYISKSEFYKIKEKVEGLTPIITANVKSRNDLEEELEFLRPYVLKLEKDVTSIIPRIDELRSDLDIFMSRHTHSGLGEGLEDIEELREQLTQIDTYVNEQVPEIKGLITEIKQEISSGPATSTTESAEFSDLIGRVEETLGLLNTNLTALSVTQQHYDSELEKMQALTQAQEKIKQNMEQLYHDAEQKLKSSEAVRDRSTIEAEPSQPATPKRSRGSGRKSTFNRVTR